TLFVILRGRAVIARRHDHKDVGPFEVLQRVFPSVHPRQSEVRRPGAERKRCCGWDIRHRDLNPGKKGKPSEPKPFHKKLLNRESTGKNLRYCLPRYNQILRNRQSAREAKQREVLVRARQRRPKSFMSWP